MKTSAKRFLDAITKLGRRVNARLSRTPAKNFVVRPKPMGPPPGLSYDKLDQLLDQLDGPMRR